MKKIAVILPKLRPDHLTITVLDGLSLLADEQAVLFRASASYPESDAAPAGSFLPPAEFRAFAKDADLVFLCWGKGDTDWELANALGMWAKTVFIDGSEVGKSRRYDFSIQAEILKGTFLGHGAISREMLEKCLLYARREKPYLSGIMPFPFGIERRYSSSYDPQAAKDIDFFCVFGQDEHPVFRRYARDFLEEFCRREGFSFETEKMPREEFFRKLARSKVGVSIGGGGYDTGRFWEVLANGCLLITETVDIFPKDSAELRYGRISECNNLYDFCAEIEKAGAFLKNGYDQGALAEEYRSIMERHSSKARVLSLIAHAEKNLK